MWKIAVERVNGLIKCKAKASASELLSNIEYMFPRHLNSTQYGYDCFPRVKLIITQHVGTCFPYKSFRLILLMKYHKLYHDFPMVNACKVMNLFKYSNNNLHMISAI